MKHNTQTIGEFAWNHLFWGGLLAWFYRVTSFRLAGTMTLTQSNKLFLLLVLTADLAGFLLTFRRRRTTLQWILNVTCPLWIYFLLSYRPLYGAQFRYLLWSLALLGLIYGILVFRSWLQDRQRGHNIPLLRVLSCLVRRCHRAFRLAMTALLLIFTLHLALAGSLISGDVPAGAPSDQTDHFQAQQAIQTQTKDDTWSTLSPSQRMDVLQTIANLEARRMGLSHALTVQAATLDPLLAGQYHHTTHLIQIQADLLLEPTPKQLLHTLLHECYHAYEYSLVELYWSSSQKDLMIFQHIQTYSREFSHYADPLEDLDAYRQQTIEQDSNRYAQDTLGLYYQVTWAP